MTNIFMSCNTQCKYSLGFCISLSWVNNCSKLMGWWEGNFIWRTSKLHNRDPGMDWQLAKVTSTFSGAFKSWHTVPCWSQNNESPQEVRLCGALVGWRALWRQETGDLSIWKGFPWCLDWLSKSPVSSVPLSVLRVKSSGLSLLRMFWTLFGVGIVLALGFKLVPCAALIKTLSITFHILSGGKSQFLPLWKYCKWFLHYQSLIFLLPLNLLNTSFIYFFF